MNIFRFPSLCTAVIFAEALLLGGAGVHAAAPEKSAEKLRSLAVVPLVTTSLGLDSEVVKNPEAAFSQTEIARRIEDLEKVGALETELAENQLRLGNYLKAADREEEAKRAFARAAKIMRRRAEAHPGDAKLQAAFADALRKAGQREEAEHVVRQALRDAPDEWPCWIVRGRLLDDLAMRATLGEYRGPAASPDLEQILSDLPQVTPGKRREAEELFADATKALDRAVSLAPKESEAYLARAMHHMILGTMSRVLEPTAHRQETSIQRFIAIASAPEMCSDMAQAVRLNPTNVGAIAFWGWIEASPGLVKAAEGPPISFVSEARRENVFEAIHLLEKLGDASDSHEAAGALEALGILRIIATLETGSAKASFRLAIRLDPSRKKPWDGLIFAAGKDEDYERMVSVCEDRLKYDDTSMNRLILAKAFDRANLPVKAIEQARLAVRGDTNDPLARLCLGAMLLKQGDSKTESEMAEHLVTASALLGKIPFNERPNELVVNGALNSAIVMALNGEKEKARKFLRQFQNPVAFGEEVQQRAREIELAIPN